MPVEPRDLSHLRKVMKAWPGQLDREMLDASRDIVVDLVGRAKVAARSSQAQLAARGLRARTDNDPAVLVSGATFKPGGRYSDVFWGAEFGGQARPTTRQFPPYRGRRGYFLTPTLQVNEERYEDMWAAGFDRSSKDWDYRGRG